VGFVVNDTAGLVVGSMVGILIELAVD